MTHVVRYVKGQLIERPLCIPLRALKNLPPPPNVSRSLQRQSLLLHISHHISSPSTLIFHFPFTFTFPQNSSPNKSDGDLTNHSFYHSEADSKPTKECCTKKAKAVKEPTSSFGKKKEASKQALNNPSHPLLMALSPSLI
ncbi:hypothetical protein DSO57_1010579 [Entomophthora muscae]|uniref:Uncharacterized protein n=1 Tax=Entomophthora muscae TaxID=34485 RepID=A0ACC2UHB2_9FUNG|nr:hypothetical protein DSO57_1010579 [Entomophthora muscae]